MCGIAGILTFNNGSPEAGAIARMSASLSHRGPDACGQFIKPGIALAHTRLSIIDINECSNQPLADPSGRYHIVFNGEIYNYRQLRSRLSQYSFSTNGDTEVILAAYIHWGSDFLGELEGMFAFAIWDNETNELFLARDRMGVKPLYYFQSHSHLIFSSEMRAILASGLVPRQLDTEAAAEFLQYQSVSFPSTIIQGITMVDAATCITVNASGKIVRRYWNLLDKHANGELTPANVKSQVRSLLRQSVSLRMVSDVPVAAFLSGGIDSSAIVGLMAEVSAEPVNTFTVAFEEGSFDESRYATIISNKFRTRHQQINLKARSFLDHLLPALDSMDSPTGDGVNTYVVSKSIAASNIKVALSGVGGDELFAGYPSFKQFSRLMRLRNWWNVSSQLRRVLAASLPGSSSKADRYRLILNSKHASVASFYPAFRQILSEQKMRQLTSLPATTHYPGKGSLHDDLPLLEQLPLLSQLSAAEYTGYTQQTLLRDMDQMSMAASIEIREPFFDHHLVSYVMSIPDQLKFPAYPKKLLVESLGDLLPGEIVHRRKQGFVLPWKLWMKTELRAFCESHLQSAAQRDFINGAQLLNSWKKFIKNDPSIGWMEIWLFVVLEKWLQKNNVN